jgi:hypothetical protein
MKIILCVLGIFLAGCLAGCETIKNAPIVTATGTAAYMGHDGVVDIIRNNFDVFSPRDLVQLRQANEQMIDVKEQIDALIDKKGAPAELVMDLPKLIPLYEQARMSYIVAHTIIMSRIDEFNRQEQMVLYGYEATCARLDVAIAESITKNGNTQTVKDILQFTLMVGKFLIPLLIL